jgi:hypothetical protein
VVCEPGICEQVFKFFLARTGQGLVPKKVLITGVVLAYEEITFFFNGITRQRVVQGSF